ncbi:MAG: bi-domain-containing oxidoreductase [Desulfatibacillaceae bacterium]
MEQLAQKLKDGNMRIIECALPHLCPGQVLVQNHFSAISAGTEGSTVSAARKGYVGKAMERPAQVKQVVDTLKSQGPVQTYRAVMKKLDTWSSLGYSSAGVVLDVGEGVREFVAGDRVACAGLTACHAEVVAVPKNLCVKLAANADLAKAAYNTLGAIAMQGVRQADLRLGETCAVIGLGILGQLTMMLLGAAGVRAVGVDVNEATVNLANEIGAGAAFSRSDPLLESRVRDLASGIGCDAVIITAGSPSTDPVNLAGALCRKRGTVVVVGAVPTGFDRDPHFYKKELTLRMSCSYGPGRYDPQYEEKGVDYPVGYVRWTEQRNMAAFQDLVHSGAVDPGRLTTHSFALEQAPEAYDMITEMGEFHLGMLIAYDPAKTFTRKPCRVGRAGNRGMSPRTVCIGFIGAGSHAQSHLLPNIPKSRKVRLAGVMNRSSESARSVAERHGFAWCTGDARDIIEDENINTVFIATRHDTHADLVCRALSAGKNVFVEKPLCLHEEDLARIEEIVAGFGDSAPGLMVGYNRRFSPFARRLRETLGTAPAAVLFRVAAGAIPADSWVQDPETGGGRILGEVCHFVDFVGYLCGSRPVSVHAAVLPDPENLMDSVCVNLTYENGSVGQIAYLANAAAGMPKERIEVHAGGLSAVVDDFRAMRMFGARGERKMTRPVQDKGQKTEVARFVEAVQKCGPMPIGFQDLLDTSRVTFAILDSLKKRSDITLA